MIGALDKPKIFRTEQRNLNEKAFEIAVLRPEMFHSQAAPKNNGVCVYRTPALCSEQIRSDGVGVNMKPRFIFCAVFKSIRSSVNVLLDQLHVCTLQTCSFFWGAKN